ncbi:MAG: DNA-binding domain-containing protein, partial [Pseudomonadota bacterium]
MKLAGGKDWYTAAELAELALPGLPKTKRKINERASAECWALRLDQAGSPLARPRVGVRGGGLEYHINILPAAARAALAAKGVGAVAHVSDVPESRSAAMWRWFEGQSEDTRSKAHERLQVLDTVALYERAGMTATAAVAAVAGRDGHSASTIWGWRSLVEGISRDDRLPYLAPQHGGGNKEVDVDPAAWQELISDYLRPSKPSFSSCYYRVKREYCEPRGLTFPHERTLRRKLDREVDARVIVARRQGADRCARPRLGARQAWFGSK